MTNTTGKILKYLCLIVLPFVLVPIIGIGLFFYMKVPTRSGTILLTNLKGEAKIKFNQEGVPYISGSSENSVLYALGNIQ